MTQPISDVKVIMPKKTKPQNEVTPVSLTQRELLFQHANISELVKTHNNLLALQSSVNRYGLTRSLISFADHDKALSTFIPAIPAIESLQHDLSVKNSTEAAAALENAITASAKNIYKTVMVFLDKVATVIKLRMGGLDVVATVIEKTVSNIKENKLSLNRDKLTTTKASLPEYSELIKTLGLLCDYISAIGRALDLPPPVNDEQFYGWVDRVHKLIVGYVSICAYVIDAQGNITHNHGCVLDEDAYPHKSLHELGYDSIDKLDNIAHMFAKTKESFAKIGSFIKKENELLRVKTDEASHKSNMKTIEVYETLITNSEYTYVWVKRWPVSAVKLLASCCESPST